MSTEHQQYSTRNQAKIIEDYAEQRGIEIIKSYADDGKSGLSIGGRASLKQLIADVESGAAEFNTILVYDVSRWGRFQDADESAYYGKSDQRVRLRRDGSVIALSVARWGLVAGYRGFRPAGGAGWRFSGRLLLMTAAAFGPETGCRARTA